MKRYIRCLPVLAAAWMLGCGGGATPLLHDPGATDLPAGDPGIADEAVPPADEGPADPGAGEGVGPEVAVDLPLEVTGGKGWPCADNAECLSGWCVETPAGRQCTVLCLSGEACEPGFACVQVAT